MSRPLKAAAFGVLVAAIAAIGLAGPASAHSQLVSSSPSSGETVTAQPAEFVATFNENLLDATGTGEGFTLQVRDAAGRHYESGCLTIDGASVSTTAVLGAPGNYMLQYQVVSADGHPVSASIPFAWAPTNPAPGAPTGSPEAPACAPGVTASAPSLTAPSPGATDATGDDSGQWILPTIIGVVLALVIVALVAFIAGRRRL